LLPTPPHGDAVTFGYREQASPGRGLSPLRSRLLSRRTDPGFHRNDDFLRDRQSCACPYHVQRRCTTLPRCPLCREHPL